MFVEFTALFDKDQSPADIELEKLGIDRPYEFQEDIVWIDIDQIESFNRSTHEEFITVWMRSGHSSMVKTTITKLKSMIDNRIKK